MISSLGDDIGSIFEDVGLAYTIIRDAGNISGEFLDYEDNRQVTKPFFIEHQLTVFLKYNSQLVCGDLLQFNTDTRRFFVMHLSEGVFENEIISKDGVLFKVNAKVDILRPSHTGTAWAPTSAWTTVLSDKDAVIDFQASSVRVDEGLDPVQDVLRRTNIVYVPKSYDLRVGDRFQVKNYTGPGPAGALNLQVQVIDLFTYRGMCFVQTMEDARP